MIPTVFEQLDESRDLRISSIGCVRDVGFGTGSYGETFSIPCTSFTRVFLVITPLQHVVSPL